MIIPNSGIKSYTTYKATIISVDSIFCFTHSGDQDSVIPLTGSRTLVQGLAQELGLKTSVPYRVWFAGMQVILPNNRTNEIQGQKTKLKK